MKIADDTQMSSEVVVVIHLTRQGRCGWSWSQKAG